MLKYDHLPGKGLNVCFGWKINHIYKVHFSFYTDLIVAELTGLNFVDRIGGIVKELEVRKRENLRYIIY